MDIKIKRRIAADVLKVGRKRVVFDKDKLDDIKEAITKKDIRNLIGQKIIRARKKKGVSRFRARKTLVQKRKGRRTGMGSRKGKKGARLSRKKQWMLSVRVQRGFIRILKDKDILIDSNYRNIYRKIKGGFFRSKRHIKLYLKEHNLTKNVQKKKTRKD